MHIDNVMFLILSNIAYTKFSEGPPYRLLEKNTVSFSNLFHPLLTLPPLFPCTPNPVMVKYVVKNRFPQNAGSGFVCAIVAYSAAIIKSFLLSKNAPL